MAERGQEVRFVTLARLVRAHGNRGEVAAELESDDPGILQRYPDVHLWDGAGARQPARIIHIRPHKNRLLLQFEGVETIDGAERLAGWLVQIPAEQRPLAPEGRYYQTDLLGCRVEEAESGRTLGAVDDLLRTGPAPLLVVKDGGREILIPFAASICVEVDPERRLIRVRLPDGLEELNQSH